MVSPTYAAAVVAVLCVIVLITRARRRAATSAAQSDSSDDETLSVNVTEQSEQDSLLPSLATLLRSPWHGEVTQQKKMRPVRSSSRSLSLTMPLPLRKKRRQEEPPTKKLHTPYFFPLLDETAQWWQNHQETAENQSQTELGADGDDNRAETDKAFRLSNAPTEQMQVEPQRFEVSVSTVIQVG